MTRATVSKHDVAKALEEFRRQGLPPPGLHRLRQAIGHGSLARIKRLQTELNLERGERLTPEAVAKVPDPISEAAARVWAELEAANDDLQKGIEADLQQARQVMADEVQSMRAEVAAKGQALEQAKGEIQRLTTRLETTEEQRDGRTQALERVKAEQAEERSNLRAAEERTAQLVAQLEEERTARQMDAKAAGTRLAEVQRVLDETKSEFAKAREAYLSQSSYAKAKADADQHQITDLHKRLLDATDAQAALREKNEALQISLDGARADVAKQREAHAASAATVQAEAEAERRERARLERRLSKLNEEHETLQERHQKTENELARSEAMLHTQQERVSELKAELKASTTTIEGLRKTSKPSR